MHSVIFFLCLSVLLEEITCDENNQRNVFENFDAVSQRRPKISSEFGYNILNSDRLSDHFRQEQRDVNGVVRGSYGFKNPNGLFRLVQYIADNRGFRAHISSNEQGIGKQNPAGVSINRFNRHPLETEDKNRPPISHLRKQNLLDDELKTTSADKYPDYAYVSPLQNRISYKNDYDSSLFRAESDAYEYDTGRHEFYSSLRQNPVDKLMRIRFNTPVKSVVNSLKEDRYNDLRRDHIWDSSPFIRQPSEDFLTQSYKRNTVLNSLNVPQASSNENKLDSFSHAQKDNYRETFSNYPDYIERLYPRPQQRVHNSLPDCNLVSSAVLCKPPLHFGDLFQEKRNSEHNPLFYDIDQLQTAKILPPNKIENSPISENVLKLIGEMQSTYPPHLIPKSYPLRSEIYKKFLSDLNGFSQSEKNDKNCQKSIFSDETAPSDYVTPLESHRLSNSGITNDEYNLDTHDSSQKSAQETSEYPVKQNEIYARLVRIIQNDESLNKLRNMLFQSSHSPQTTTYENEKPKLNLLGVLILPSSVIKELDEGQMSHSKYIPKDFDEKSLQGNSFESDVSDMTKYLIDDNKTVPTVDYDESIEYKNDASVEEDQPLGNETKNLLMLPSFQLTLNKNNLPQTIDYNSSYTELPAETVTSPKLYVYDEQNLSVDKKNNNSNFSEDNWRKILEDEISKEIRDSSLHQDRPLISFDESSNPEPNKHDNQYGLNKHIGPLYDSTGKLIQPENVPIHIHRFNPPSAQTSLPWKFSIPRPAPPRSIVVPPKPPTL